MIDLSAILWTRTSVIDNDIIVIKHTIHTSVWITVSVMKRTSDVIMENESNRLIIRVEKKIGDLTLFVPE